MPKGLDSGDLAVAGVGLLASWALFRLLDQVVVEQPKEDSDGEDAQQARRQRRRRRRRRQGGA